jgi:3-phenylpropionate/cinnamic acid dioxygenase small subunit
MNFEDYHAIEQLLYKYPEYADAGNFDGVGELFAHCDMIVPGQPTTKAMGAKANTEHYRSWVRLYPDSGTPKTRHLMSNISIESDGAPDRAKSRSYVVVFQKAGKVHLQPIVAGTYLDKFKKVDGKWRFVERHDCSEHLLKPWN